MPCILNIEPVEYIRKLPYNLSQINIDKTIETTSKLNMQINRVNEQITSKQDTSIASTPNKGTRNSSKI
jgi:hypothetical protein